MSTITITEPAVWPSAVLQVRVSWLFPAENQINTHSFWSWAPFLFCVQTSPTLQSRPKKRNTLHAKSDLQQRDQTRRLNYVELFRKFRRFYHSLQNFWVQRGWFCHLNWKPMSCISLILRYCWTNIFHYIILYIFTIYYISLPRMCSHLLQSL